MAVLFGHVLHVGVFLGGKSYFDELSELLLWEGLLMFWLGFPHPQIMKASLLADDDDLDLILDYPGKPLVKMDTSQEICSPRLPISKSQGQKRHSGMVRNHSLCEKR